MGVRSVGVEEELLLVEPDTGRPRAVAAAVLRVGDAAGGPEAGSLSPGSPGTGSAP
ncbi:MAG: hypothetical protein JWL68_5116, partial [Actinomycetia bacterium]|nr:hypothetical protein [Actinomycetes bacterium]